MPRPFPLRSAVLALLLLLSALPLAYLCRGRTPTRFDANNLPVWERHSAAAHHHTHKHRQMTGFQTALKR